jgi:Cytochrome C oxidase, cbb3-type, subunit III
MGIQRNCRNRLFHGRRPSSGRSKVRLSLALAAALATPAAWTQSTDVPRERLDEEAFFTDCGYCHLQGGTGTLMMSRRLGEAKGLLTERGDLAGDYIRFVVRHGLLSMPALTRVEVTDAELDGIVRFLTGPYDGIAR